jgi:succinoglycan biosynthesis protein ExoM
VCACTYQRTGNLVSLLDGLLNQKTNDQFSYSIIIVDNDPSESARDIVSEYFLNGNVKVEYYTESQKGLSYARNKCLEWSRGKYIAFIDDDEVPEKDWLYQLYKALKEYDADAVFGSVLPEFEVTPPNWILKRRYFYWRDERHQTGVKTKKAVTNNVLFRRDLVVRYNLKFDPDHALIGGEDMAFFYQLSRYKKDARFIDCKDAIVREILPPNRCSPEYIQKRNSLEAWESVNQIHKYFAHSRLKKIALILHRFAHSWIRLMFINLLLPFLLLVNRDLGIEYYHRSFFHHGILLAIFKYTTYKNRQSIGLQ